MKIYKMFKESITREELTDLPLRWFEGKIMVVDSLTKLKGALKILNNEKVIGFDTETKPSFKKGVNNQVALLQLSSRNHAFLFRLNKIGLPKEIKELLEASGFEVLELKKFHELSFPYSFYLKKLLKSDLLVKLLLPFVHIFFVIFPIRNKMLAIGKKK